LGQTLVSPLASFKSDLGIPGAVDNCILLQRHLEVCNEILKITQRLEADFFDSTIHLLHASSKHYIHGPRDWDHLNETGYRALADGISQFLLYPADRYQNCKN
jgi:hypothetical protein